MKILFLRANPVSPDSRVEKEVAALKEAGHDVSIFAWDRSKNCSNYLDKVDIGGNRIDITRCGIESEFGAAPIKMLVPLIRFQFKLLAYLLKNIRKFDVIHACDFDTAFVSVLLGKLFHKKCVYDIFDYYVDAFDVPGFLKGIIAALDRVAMNLADKVIVCTRKRIQQIPPIQAEKIYVVQNTPDISHVQKEEVPSDRYAIHIAYFGILQEGRLVKELADVVSRNSDWHLDIGGFGLLAPYISDMADKHENITFYGKIDYQTVLKMETRNDILTAIYTPENKNHRYAAPNKFYEAMALGKPLIVCRDTFVDEYVQQLDCGEVIDYSEIGLENAIVKLAARRNEWNSMGSRMRECYEQELCWEYSKAELIKCYASI